MSSRIHVAVRRLSMAIVTLSVLAAPAARLNAAAPADLFFSEYIEGTGNNKAYLDSSVK